jgi:hypothetical protein
MPGASNFLGQFSAEMCNPWMTKVGGGSAPPVGEEGDEIAANAVVVSPVITASHSLSNGPYGFDLDEGNYAVVSNDADCWIQIDFGESKSIGHIRLRGGPDVDGTQSMTLKTSPNETTWTTIASWSGQTYYTTISEFFEVARSDVRYIRVSKLYPNFLRMYYMGVTVYS